MIIRFIRFLFLVGIFYFLYRWLWKWPQQMKKKRGEEKPPNLSNNPPPTDTVPKIIAEMKKDPVCGTYIPENQAIILESQGNIHYFCSEECKQKFRELPK